MVPNDNAVGYRAGPLFHEGRKTAGKTTAVQLACDLDRPILVKVVKQPGRHPGPVVNGHFPFSRITFLWEGDNRILTRGEAGDNSKPIWERLPWNFSVCRPFFACVSGFNGAMNDPPYGTALQGSTG